MYLLLEYDPAPASANARLFDKYQLVKCENRVGKAWADDECPFWDGAYQDAPKR